MITQNHIIEFIALLTGVAYWRYLKHSKLFWLPFFLFAVLLVELSGSIIQRCFHWSNAGLYNFSIPFEYLFYLYLFSIHGNSFLKKFTKIAAVLLVTIAVFYFIESPVNTFHNYVLLTGQLTVIVCACLYIYECFIDVKELPLLKDYFFWITAGLLLFNLGDFGYSLIFPAIRDFHWDEFGLLFKSINNSFLVLLYFSYIIAIIVYKKYSATDA